MPRIIDEQGAYFDALLCEVTPCQSITRRSGSSKRRLRRWPLLVLDGMMEREQGAALRHRRKQFSGSAALDGDNEFEFFMQPLECHAP